MKVQRTRIALAVSMAIASAMLQAQAQQADAPASAPVQNAAPAVADDGTSQVVVTGIRASRQQSLKAKRDADSVMDVVSSEDIGKLPDKNVADAVQRVPGVNISSGSGGQGGFSENDRVTIRGTNPSLTQTLVNGHSISTGDWYIGDQQGTVGRSVSFTLLPSEIVGSVEVQKSSQADFTEGGTVGNVNIVTRLPLEFKKQLTVEMTAQDMYADLPKKSSPQFNALVNWKNDENTLGVLLQGFSESRAERRDGQELYTLGASTISDPSVIAAHPDLAGVNIPAQIGSAAFTQTSKRQGGLFDVQFKPNKDLTLDVNGLYSRFTTQTFDTNFMANVSSMFNGSGNADGTYPGVSPTSYVVKNGSIVSATFPMTTYDPAAGGGQALPGVRDSIYRPNSGSSAAYIDFDSKFRASDTVTFTSKVGYTRGTGETPHDYGYEAYLINSPLSFQMNGTHGPANVSFPGVDTTNFNNPTNVVNGGSWAQSAKVTDSETYAQGDMILSLDQGHVESAKFGIRFSNHQRKAFDEGYSCTSNPLASCDFSSTPPPAWNGTRSPSNFGSGIGAGPGFLSNFWVLDTGALAAWEQKYNNVDTGPAYQNNFSINEKDYAAYGMANLVGDHWRGNVGVRLVETQQIGNAYDYSSDGTNFFVTPITSKHNYLDVLPSANLKLDVNKDLVARFAASETMSRLDYSALSPAVVLNNLDHSGSSGNSSLKSIKSNNVDAALEWYYAPQAILSAGVFYMDMPSYIGYTNVVSTYFDSTNHVMAPYNITTPYNISAKNHGIELSWQQTFSSGFGGLLNYTYADGHDSNGSVLVGSSKNTANTEAFYENDRFSARLAYTYRSAFLVGLANTTTEYAAGFGTLAASINYKVNDNIKITFDALNLNNPVLKYYANPEQPESFYSNGRQYFLGVRVSL